MFDIINLSLSVVTFFIYLSILTSSGTVICILLFKLTDAKKIVILFGYLGLISSIFGFALKGANLTGDLYGMIDKDILMLLWTTPIGTSFFYQIFGLLLIILGSYIRANGIWISIFGGIAAIYSFLQIGHLADKNNILLNIILIMHLISVAFWIGILLPLKKLIKTPPRHIEAVEVGQKFGILAIYIIPILALAGIIMSYSIVGSFSALVYTKYGQTLLLKIAFFVIVLALGATNKLILIPQLKNKNPQASVRLINVINIEYLFILLILLVTTILTTNINLPM